MPRSRPWILLAPFAALLLLAASPMAGAHTFLVSTSPEQGERLSDPPDFVELRFTEPVLPGSVRLELRSSTGRSVDTPPPRLQPGDLTATMPVPDLRHDAYVLGWQVTSAVDAHEEAGEFAFSVGRAAALPQARSTSGVAWPEAAAGWLALGGLLAAFGGLASERWIWASVIPSYADGAPPRLPVAWMLGIAFVGVVGQTSLAAKDGWASLAGGRAGALLIVQALAIGYGLWMSPLRRLRAWTLVPVTLALVAAALQGHPGSGPAAWWSAPLNILHILAAGLWIGGLGHLLVVLARSHGTDAAGAVAAGSRRYARVAAWAVALAVTSGVGVAISQLSAPAELLTTTYGRLLSAKLGLLSLALLLAVLARRRALRSTAHVRRPSLDRLARPEAALLLVVVAAASAVAESPPPRRAAASAAALLGPQPLTGDVLRLADLAGSLAVHLAAAPDRLQVQIIEPSRTPAAGSDVSIRATTPRGRAVTIHPRHCGSGCASTAFRWMRGTTTVVVQVSSPQWQGGDTTFDVPWPPSPARPELVEQTIRVMSAVPRLELTETVTSGPGSRSVTTTAIAGRRFVELEVYAEGAIEDVRPLESADGRRVFTAFLPGSWIWLRLETDDQGRIAAETIVSPGHRIDRSFAYPP